MSSSLITQPLGRVNPTLPNARLMTRHPLGGAQGRASETWRSKEIIRLKLRLDEILVKHTDQAMEETIKDTDRDCFPNARTSLTFFSI